MRNELAQYIVFIAICIIAVKAVSVLRFISDWIQDEWRESRNWDIRLAKSFEKAGADPDLYRSGRINEEAAKVESVWAHLATLDTRHYQLWDVLELEQFDNNICITRHLVGPARIARRYLRDLRESLANETQGCEPEPIKFIMVPTGLYRWGVDFHHADQGE